MINSEDNPVLSAGPPCILQAIGSKVELLALTDVEYFTYRFTELPLLCEERYKDILERAYAPLTTTPCPSSNWKIIRRFNGIFQGAAEHVQQVS